MKIYLASSSPRRIRLLKWFGLPYEVLEHGFDEESLTETDSETLVGQLALQKAYNAGKEIKGGGLVIGSDLVASIDEYSWSRPHDMDEARMMLKTLRGREHDICCGVAVYEPKTGKAVMSVDKTRVWIKDFSDDVLERYLREVPVLDRGGAYGVQDEISGFGSVVEKFEGAITTIIGLPMEHLENLLKEFGVKAKKDWRKICKKETGYEQ